MASAFASVALAALTISSAACARQETQVPPSEAVTDLPTLLIPDGWPLAITVPPPTGETGVITGRLITPNAQGVPYLGTFYLADLLYPTEGTAGPLLTFSEADSPKATQDASGRFVFSTIPPGEYGIMIWNPMGSSFLRDPGTGQPIVVTVEAGKVVDLATVVIP